MDVPAYGRMCPLYEAMTVCSSTIQWFERHEKERKETLLQSRLGDLVRVMDEFITAASSTDLLAGAAPTEVTGSIYCLEAVNSMSQIITREVQENIGLFAGDLRDPINSLLRQVEVLTERVEGILEAWKISIDPDLSPRLRSAVERLDFSKKDIPPWREALELLHD
ncbi:MAG: hypothetical protein HYR60_18355 [Acidobacteria bacterium]|nr:hypothetical protein [Acidobacteriota bacterium]